MHLPIVRVSTPPVAQQVYLSQVGYIPDGAMANGIRLLGASGSGKTVLATWLLLVGFLRHWAYVALDPAGSLITGFLTRVQHYCESNRLSDRQQARLYNRIVYADLSGHAGYIVPFPLFRRFPGEPLAAVGDRVMSWILSMMPESKDAPVEGYTSISKILRPAALILAALDLEITELPDLLNCFEKKGVKEPWQTRFDYLLATQEQEVGEAVRFFKQEYSTWDKNLRDRRLNLLEVVMQMFRYNPTFRATFGAGEVGLDYEQIIREGKIVLLDASRLSGEYKQLLLNWILLYSFTPYIWWRGSGDHPRCGLLIDEISTFYMDTPKAMELFSQSFGELVHVLRRQYGIHPLCVLHQTVAQLHPKMAAHLAALGNQIIGKPADYASALLLAEQLFDYHPVVKRWEPIYMSVFGRGPQVIDYRPVEYSREEILHLQAQILLRLDTFKFFSRLTRTEGGGQGPLQQLDTKPLLGPYPDPAKVATLRQQLAVASGLGLEPVLADILDRKERGLQHRQGNTSATITGRDDKERDLPTAAEHPDEQEGEGIVWERAPATPGTNSHES